MLKSALPWLLLACVGTACQKKEDFIPRYPEASLVKGDTFETDTFRLYRQRIATPDTAMKVKSFYDRLLQKEGWSFEGDPEEFMTWTHSNMRPAEGSEGYAARDPSKPGGVIQVEVGDSTTLIETWSHVPK